MKTSIKAIIGTAVTAAMAVGIVVTATADTTGQSFDQTGNFQIEVENGYTPFELLLLEGRKATDVNRVSDDGVPNGTLIFVAPAAAAADTDLTLVNVHDSSDSYKLWSGRFIKTSIANMSATFTEPEYFDCTIGKEASMTTTNVMKGDYKKVHIVYTYLENGKTITKDSVNFNTSQTCSVNAPIYSGSGKLVEAAYFFYLNASPDSDSPLYKVAYVHLVESGYAQSAAYAQNSYAGLIDKYTYVYTSELAE